MELSTTAVAHIALDQMITANVLLGAITESEVAVPALTTLRMAIQELMAQFNPVETVEEAVAAQ